jgi:thiol:disulfide interchange protein DsbD
MLLAILAMGLNAQAAVEPVKAELVTSVTAAQPGKSFLAAVVLRTDPNVHVYWVNPGGAGVATKVVWQLPTGWKAGELMWPVPSRFSEKEQATLGYEGATMLLARITPSADAKVGPMSFAAYVSWTAGPMQKPGTANLKRSLSISQKEFASQMWADRLAAAEATMPAKVDGWTFTAEPVEGGYILKSKPPQKLDPWKALPTFYALEENVIDASWPQRLIDQADGSFWIGLKRSPKLDKEPAVIRGILVAPKGMTWKEKLDAMIVEAPIIKPLTSSL